MVKGVGMGVGMDQMAMWMKKKMSHQLKQCHIINLLAMYTENGC